MANSRALDTLDIDSDDSGDILETVEKAFGIKISDAEAESCQTVGDLFRIICSHISVVDRSDVLPCITAFSFRALRRAIQEREPGLDLRPDTALANFAGDRDHRAWHAHLAQTTGLSVTRPTLDGLSVAVCLALLGVVASGAIIMLGHGVVGSVVIVVLSAAVLGLGKRHARMTWETGKTLGDLAKETAAFSVAHALRRHGAVRSREVWQALTTLMRPYARQPGELVDGTHFFAKGQ